MNLSDYKPEVDDLRVGLTRPIVFMGVNMHLFIFYITFYILFCIYTYSLYGVPLFVATHILVWRLSAKEPNFFNIWFVAFTKTPPVMNGRFWGKTNSYEPW